MYGIFTNIRLKNQPNVGKYIIHGAYGYAIVCLSAQIALASRSEHHFRNMGTAMVIPCLFHG